MTNFLINKIAGKNPDFKDPKVRSDIGYLGGIVGIIINVLLFIIKLSIGLLVSSIAVLADAFNNLSDAASSVITILGFKLANKPPDKDHPYGHGRIEYISALIVAFMVILVGFQFIKSSIGRIINPQALVFQLVPFIILLLSIAFKLWLGYFSNKLGALIDSNTLKATATDAVGDVFTTSVVLLSLLLTRLTSFPLDGYIGVVVAIIIILAGFNLVKETISPLIGEAPDKDMIEAIEKNLLDYKYITGVHDLVVHNYGPNRSMATIHVEFPSTIDVMDIHEVIDRAERELSKKFNLDLVIHMDPININDEETIIAREIVQRIADDIEEIKSIHDFRIVHHGDKKDMIFDLVVDGNKIDKYKEKKIKKKLIEEIRKENKEYNFIINVDRSFIG